jgi:S1-C subfamily serine protease
MVNKVIIGILALILVLMGGIGYYSYTLSQQIEYLSEQLTISEMEQTARIDTLRGELIALRTETLSGLSTLEDKIGETMAEIDTLKEEIVATQDSVAGLEEEIEGVASQADILEDSLTEFSRSVIDASAVYQKVSPVTVRISDGQSTIGSGLIFDTEGHVVTAHHVVEGLSQIYVILHDGRTSKATNIGHCERSDIAVLKLEDNPAVEPLPLADSGQVRIGEAVVAIGSPFDLRDTLTSGIISQINRYTEIQYNTESRWVANLLQFDAAVNAGNSGCPLANSDGEIIGIVVARVFPSEGDGIYYAVAANKVKRVATAIIDQGYFDYPRVGIGLINLTPQIAQDRALETANGILVVEVLSESPAEAAGIKIDDIIVSIDDTPVTDSADINAYLGEFKSPGDIVTIGLIRGTTKLELELELGKWE